MASQSDDISPLDLASLLCSKLCHDLLNPVGALNNGIELLADETDPAMRDQCLRLLADSARTTAAKLKFFRLAFGSAGGYGDAIATRDLRESLLGLFPASGRLALNWVVTDPTLPKTPAKLLLNMATIIGDALPRGGTLTVGTELREATCEIVVRGEGAMLKLDDEIRSMLASAGSRPPSARSASAWMVRAMVDQAGGSLAIDHSPDNALLLGAAVPV